MHGPKRKVRASPSCLEDERFFQRKCIVALCDDCLLMFFAWLLTPWLISSWTRSAPGFPRKVHAKALADPPLPYRPPEVTPTAMLV